MNLTTLTEEHAPLPLGTQIQNLQANGGGNVHDIAKNIALRSCPPSELPPGLRAARQRIDAAQMQKAEAEAELNAKLADWQRYQTLLTGIANRRKHLGFATERLALAKGAVANLQTNFAAIQDMGHPNTWAGAVELVRDVVLCRELVKLLPVWIEREAAAVAELDAQATELEKRYGE